MTTVSVRWRWDNRTQYRTGVSLHSHTSRSRETMSFVPRHTAQVPVLASGIRKLEARYRRAHGHEIDYSSVWWTPPLSPHEAFHLEATQIEEKFGARPIVSLTDHDEVSAPAMLNRPDAPVSVEWTVPSGPVFFHVGLHNVPADWMPFFAAATADPTDDNIISVLEAVDARPESLIVLNHPMWDEIRAGKDVHMAHLKRLLARFGRYFHAMEINGLRPCEENRQALKLSNELGLPAVSGGDRHGLEPNANVNLTNAETFEEFAQEIRKDQVSHIVFLEQYREPIKLRMFRVIADAVRDMPGSAWSDRVFWRNRNGLVQPISAILPTPAPGVIGQFLALVRFADCHRVQKTLRWALQEKTEYAL